MRGDSTRRDFLSRTVLGGAALGMGSMSFLDGLAPLRAEDVRIDPKIVRLDPSIEPLVRLIEDTPRDDLLEQIGARVRAGLGYRDLLAALFLAGVRNVQPRPSVGFKFHAVLVVNSAHLASLSSPDSLRWLPIFWTLDYFKSSQARDVKEGNWTMAPVDESAVPKAHRARKEFQNAMDSWDEGRADAAAAGLSRHAGSQEIYELFCRYGARDFRAIGHKAIFVSNAWRTLSTIGRQHAEPVLRSLAYALQNHGEKEIPSKIDADADRPWRANLELAKKIPKTWRGGKRDAGARDELLQTFRTGSERDASELVVKLLERGVSPDSLWDACFQSSSEMVMRRPGIISLHSVTTTNALHFAYKTSGVDNTRRMMLLQNAAFLPLFRKAVIGRSGALAKETLGDLGADVGKLDPKTAMEDIFNDLGSNKLLAARKTYQYLESGGSAWDLINAARALVFVKSDDAHAYKFSSAVLEDYYNASPESRNAFLASSMFMLHGSGAKNNRLLERTQKAISG